MLDIKWIRENPNLLDEALAKRSMSVKSAEILCLDKDRRAALAKLQVLQEQRNKLTSEIAAAMKAGKAEQAELHKQKVLDIKAELALCEERSNQVAEQLRAILDSIPNVPLDDVPVGSDETGNVEIHKYGIPTEFSFTAKQHFDLGHQLGLMDFEKAGQMAGARFTILKGALARLERAIGQFMLDIHVGEHGYREVSVPLLVRDNAAYGTAQLPKFTEDLFKTTDGRWLISTAEIPLTNMVSKEILAAADLPIRLTALTPCFRSEAGAAGRDTRGMLRQHQFWKVELVSIATPSQSQAELERMRNCAQNILELLKLPYRTVVLCTGDMGFAAQKTYDIEVWLPGQDAYREISSCSLCGDFQARRMDARYREEGQKDLRFVHTLNGSGTAVGRCLIAIMENYQQADGSIVVPEVLVDYMRGQKIIQPE